MKIMFPFISAFELFDFFLIESRVFHDSFGVFFPLSYKQCMTFNLMLAQNISIFHLIKVKQEGEKQSYVFANYLAQSKEISLNVYVFEARREYGSVVTVDSPHSDILHFDIVTVP